ncbi:glycosyltransferase [Candidatus Methylacidithermus pantelleriae]|uniref:NodB homology domain-containing protein n=1 Tax=Candidatus Methylacidithermus pantelleriae TaxID=2744239 RepID=A0A8J2BN25_9BACT|nr:glycosyltransferase [Candidatus Methylacidithermus pantelleriae]CAF0694726.1 NodB homology domain-containing protein [Candidatus Methylacidithermus pantelleriae]
MDSPESFVFADPHGRRWSRLKRVLVLVTGLLVAAVALFVHSLWVTPSLPLPKEIEAWKKTIRALREKTPESRLSEKDRAWQRFLAKRWTGGRRNRTAIPPVLSVPQVELHVAFLPAGDSVGWESLKKHGQTLTHLCPEWLWVRGLQTELVVQPDPRVLTTASALGLHLLPVLSNSGEGAPDPEAIEALVRAPQERWDQFISQILAELDKLRAQGIVLDWEGLDRADRDQYTRFVELLAAKLHEAGKELWLCVPMGDGIQAWDLNFLSSVVDRFVARLHDENSEKDPPGPIASQPWFEGWLTVALGYGRPEQWITVLGTYGYDWTEGESEADTIRFVDAMVRAKQAGVTLCRSERPLLNPHFVYSIGGLRHSVWFLDAITFLNELQAAREKGVGGIGIYPLGGEDPWIWDLLRVSPGSDPDATLWQALQELSPDQTIAHLGEGEFLTTEIESVPGHRILRAAGRNQVEVDYDRFPSYPTLYHAGVDPTDHRVALTFDDGPDPKWTPKILDILKAKHAPATFFVTGVQAEKYPGLVHRIVAEGHLLGNHTYTHPDLSVVPREQIVLELNATRRLIEFLTGRSTVLFRPPYDADTRPDDLRKLLCIELAQQMGYITVSSGIDPEDWSRPRSEVLLRRVRQARHFGNILLLHDSGGDRSQTVEALPRIIDYLRARGDRIVSLEELVGLASSDVMPVVSQQGGAGQWVSGIGFVVWRWWKIISLSFVSIATVMVVARTVLLVALAWWSEAKRPKKKGAACLETRGVSVVIAAYREEAVIGRTLASVLRNGYPGPLELIVVDDGSTDGTARVVRQMSQKDSRVRLFQQPNRGKAHALQLGLANARYPWLVFLDADTQAEPGALARLVSSLDDPGIGAVSGHLKVGNTQKWLGRFQALEYLCGFHLERKAYRICDAITVVPGAWSAVKRDALEKAGGIQTDTVAEDTDLTLRIHQTGYRVEYTPEAIAWTEAPETFSGLLRQRVRWAYGTLQCLWKHRELLFDRKLPGLGFISLPSAWFFQVILPALSPWIDLAFLLSLVFGHVPLLLAGYCAAFLLVDLATALLASCWEKEPARIAWRVLPMRVVYRPLLALAVWRAIARALRGAWGGWGKLERRATVLVGT